MMRVCKVWNYFVILGVLFVIVASLVTSRGRGNLDGQSGMTDFSSQTGQKTASQKLWQSFMAGAMPLEWVRAECGSDDLGSPCSQSLQKSLTNFRDFTREQVCFPKGLFERWLGKYFQKLNYVRSLETNMSRQLCVLDGMEDSRCDGFDHENAEVEQQSAMYYGELFAGRKNRANYELQTMAQELSGSIPEGTCRSKKPIDHLRNAGIALRFVKEWTGNEAISEIWGAGDMASLAKDLSKKWRHENQVCEWCTQAGTRDLDRCKEESHFLNRSYRNCALFSRRTLTLINELADIPNPEIVLPRLPAPQIEHYFCQISKCSAH